MSSSTPLPPPPPKNPQSKNPAPPKPIRLATKNADVAAAMKKGIEVSEKGGRPDAGAAGDKTRDLKSAFAKVELENPGHDWLKYESLYNHIQFQHTAERLPFGSYSFPLDKLRVVLLPGLSEAALTRIRTAFFPKLPDNAALKACCFQPWAADYNQDVEAKAKSGQPAHMPYNAVCNDETGRALGTRAIPRGAPAAGKLKYEWAMWQTASRSCVIELAASVSWPRDQAGVRPGPEGAYDVLPWDFANGNNRIKGYRDVVSDPQDPVKQPRPIMKVSELTDSSGEPLCFGVKTGVVWVGAINQNSKDSGEKGTLEKESLAAALRSNYIIAIEQFLDAQRAQGARALVNSRAIVVLPEVLTVTCIDPSLDDKTGDGFQLRDLSRLSRDMMYFPPLSIPYVGRSTDAAHPVNFNDRSEYFAGLADTPGHVVAPYSWDWASYWSDNFASRVGQAKAILHLVYGLQPLTPNAQNFLLEMSPDSMSANRVVCRDILDMKLHSDWVATIFGARANPLDTTPVSLAKIDFKGFQPVVALLEYEKRAPSIFDPAHSMIADSETFADVVGPPPYYKDTQLNWFPYTSLHRGSAVALGGSKVSSAGPARPPGWQMMLYVNAQWGLTHAMNYALAVNSLLDPSNTEDKPLYKPIDYRTFTNGIPLAFTHKNLQDRVQRVTFLASAPAGAAAKTFGVDPDANTAPFAFDANAMEFAALPDDEEGYKRAGQLFDLFSQWERSVSAIIHKTIYGTEEGRKMLRQFHGL